MLETLAGSSRATWTLISQHAQPGEVTAETVALLFPTPGLISAFTSRDGGSVLSQAIFETLGLRLRVVVDVAGPDGGPGGGGPRGGGGAPSGGDRGGARRGPGAGGEGSVREGREPQWGDDGGRRAPGARDGASATASSAPAVGDEFGEEPPSDGWGDVGPEPVEDPYAPDVETPSSPTRPSSEPSRTTEHPVVERPEPGRPAAASAATAVPAASAAPPSERRVVSEAVARALADWDDAPAPASQAPPATQREARPDRDDAGAPGRRPAETPAEGEPAARAPLSVVHPPAAARADEVADGSVIEGAEHEVRLAGTAAHAEPRTTDRTTGSDAGDDAALAPVIELHARGRASATTTPARATPSTAPAPWEDADEAELDDAYLDDDASVSSVGSGLMGATLVVKMLGGAVIDEITDGVADVRR
ncbi:hypothetical protein [Litorihabitans aurantiacus]|uniref:Uncharacterized protein n=1 Tax=Litorihabitans aurantiacus TaxID=1930061 RepID=A0AA38CV91_9MICO|nr:hypothetical protein [Litorihabitans aurantiacus]GMA32620.1 hypothetical protein GCM10025875_26120 [Litorihabitans aurantiacus]